MKTDEVFLQRQPKHILMSLVIVRTGEKFPLSGTQQKVLDELEEVSDVFYIISPWKEELGGPRLDPAKFCSLHGGIGYLECSRLSGNEALLKVLQYSVEIFGKHLGYIITRIEDLGGFKKTTISNLVALNNSTITRPVLKIGRLGPEILYRYYDISDDDTGIEKKSTTLRSLLGGGKKKITQPKSNIGMYSRYTSQSEASYLRTATVRLILDCMWTPKFFDFVASFADMIPESSDYRYFLASLLKDMGVDNIDADPGELEIGKL